MRNLELLYYSELLHEQRGSRKQQLLYGARSHVVVRLLLSIFDEQQFMHGAVPFTSNLVELSILSGLGPYINFPVTLVLESCGALCSCLPLFVCRTLRHSLNHGAIVRARE